MDKLEKRVKLQCWQCQREYSLLRDVGQAMLEVECPFCYAKGEVDLAPWRSPVVNIHKGEGGGQQALGELLDLPAVLPTTPRQTEE
ncbi:MAG TPA: hypothetical protein PLD25_16375 [Chloroflexota bacterium]|nr:hypothetical protein [Chloroflexota bacterium]